VVHVGSRGVDRRTIFEDDDDRRAFLSLLAAAVREGRLRSLNHCLMGNHYHLVVEALDEPLGLVMRDLLGGYARGFNQRHGREGHLFERRFWSACVTSLKHMVALARYAAYNPVAAGLCRAPDEWAWSAHRELVGSAAGRTTSGSSRPSSTSASERCASSARRSTQNGGGRRSSRHASQAAPWTRSRKPRRAPSARCSVACATKTSDVFVVSGRARSPGGPGRRAAWVSGGGGWRRGGVCRASARGGVGVGTACRRARGHRPTRRHRRPDGGRNARGPRRSGALASFLALTREGSRRGSST
jgi:REP element-mobilizing transposase RayT